MNLLHIALISLYTAGAAIAFFVSMVTDSGEYPDRHPIFRDIYVAVMWLPLVLLIVVRAQIDVTRARKSRR